MLLSNNRIPLKLKAHLIGIKAVSVLAVVSESSRDAARELIALGVLQPLTRFLNCTYPCPDPESDVAPSVHLRWIEAARAWRSWARYGLLDDAPSSLDLAIPRSLPTRIFPPFRWIFELLPLTNIRTEPSYAGKSKFGSAGFYCPY